MNRFSTAVLTAIAICVAGAVLIAHQVTYKGTVLSVGKESVKVTVIDEKTKKPGPMDFDFDKETKILRGDKVVPMSQAQIQKGEKISVTVDHDADEKYALVIRLDVRK